MKRRSQYGKREQRGRKRRLGPAWTLPEPLRLAIQLRGSECGGYMAGWEKEDRAKASAHEVKRAEEARVEHRLAVEAKVAKTQWARAVELAPTTAELADHLEAYKSGTAKVAYLKEQHSGFMARAPTRRCKFHFPVKVGVEGGVVASVAHLTELLSYRRRHCRHSH